MNLFFASPFCVRQLIDSGNVTHPLELSLLEDLYEAKLNDLADDEDRALEALGNYGWEVCEYEDYGETEQDEDE